MGMFEQEGSGEVKRNGLCVNSYLFAMEKTAPCQEYSL